MTRVIDSFSGKFEFLSNFSRHSVFILEQQFPTAEHAFQAHKTLDTVEFLKILRARTPRQARNIGKFQITLRDDWEDIKLDVMHDVVFAKFRQNAWLRRQLFLTGDTELIEGNWWHDTFWGVCTGKCKHGPHNSAGSNHLGLILMQVREELFND